MITLIKWMKPFPIRTLKEIFSLNDLKKEFNNNFLTYSNIDFKKINDKLAEYFYMKYRDRYPYTQDTTLLKSLINQLKDTYIDTFYNNVFRILGKKELSMNDFKDLISKGNTLQYNTKSGSSVNPYNIALNDISGIITEDSLANKNLSNTVQTKTNSDIITRSFNILNSKLSGEITNFVNSFYSLFSQQNLDEYVDYNLHIMVEAYKKEINYIIDLYNKLLPKIKEILIKGGK